jgi:hypothetical protein
LPFRKDADISWLPFPAARLMRSGLPVFAVGPAAVPSVAHCKEKRFGSVGFLILYGSLISIGFLMHRGSLICHGFLTGGGLLQSTGCLSGRGSLLSSGFLCDDGSLPPIGFSHDIWLALLPWFTPMLMARSLGMGLLPC